MLPFIRKLPFGNGNFRGNSGLSYLRKVEAVSTTVGLLPDSKQIGIKQSYGIGRGTKPHELWMIPVAGGLTQQYFARKKSLAPTGCKTLRVQITGMYRPQAHKQ